MERRTRFDAVTAKRSAVTEAEAAGQVADSMEVRLALMARVEKGEITFQQAHEELAAIKRGAKEAGKVTRSQAFNQG